MTQTITTYYIPQNLSITKGKIYNLYINKVTNLDLTSIISPKKEITISETEINELINLTNIQANIYNKTKELIKKITKEGK